MSTYGSKPCGWFARPAVLAVLVLGGALSGCGNAGPSTGQVELRVLDSSPASLGAVVVSFSRAEAHVLGRGWVVLTDGRHTIDLLSLRGGTPASLGFTALPAGRVTQLRLYLDPQGPAFVIASDGVRHDLAVPDAASGIRIVGGFDAQAGAIGSLTFGFDVALSIHAGHGGTYVLHPVVRLKAVHLHRDCDEVADRDGDRRDGDDRRADDRGDDHRQEGRGEGRLSASHEHDGDDCSAPGPDPCLLMVCPVGDLCQNGACVVLDPCLRVVCPTGQLCEAGVCVMVDPCQRVVCPTGQVCQAGSCVAGP